MHSISLLLVLLLSACNPPIKQQPNEGSANAPQPAVGQPAAVSPYSGSLPLNKIKLPPGFVIDVFAEGVKNARSMALSPSGTLFVGTRDAGNVYALRDTNGDHRADQQFLIARGLNMPNGVAFRNGALFVAEISRVLRFDDIENRLANPGDPVVVYDKYPKDEHHGWKYIAFGPDGKLYVPVGAPCNICEREEPIYSSITRIDVDRPGQPEIVAHGVRNSVGFTWHPTTRQLWFTDNGRDWLGDDTPPCELNRVERDGQHFGYPYCHGGTIKDPKFGDKRPCSDFVAPAQNLNAHVAPLGLEFYTGAMFPETYKNQAFIAEHGSWNRAKKIGYQVSLVRLSDDGRGTRYEPFASGWLDGDNVWGRPVDVELLPDGSMLVSDDYADAIYRIYYQK